MKFLLAMVAFVVLNVSMPAISQSGSDNRALYGVGSRGCGDYIAARRKNDEMLDAIYYQWLLGFATGRNLYGPTGVHIQARLPKNEFLAYMDEFCRLNPLTHFFLGGRVIASRKRVR
ncbi:MAG: hypothetical protein LRY31_00235 [Burkholderiaceae bacterium]|nr:hypothetical protein [Burkholderiaceae bacterium]